MTTEEPKERNCAAVDTRQATGLATTFPASASVAN